MPTINDLQLRNIHTVDSVRGGARLLYPADFEDWEIKDVNVWLPRATGNPGMASTGALDHRIQLPAFDANTQERIDFRFSMPKGYALNEDFYFKLDWAPSTDDGGKVRWAMTVSAFDHSADNSRLRFNNEYSITYDHKDDTADGTPTRFKSVLFGPYTGFDKARMTVIGSLYRDVNVDTPYASDALLANFVMYYKSRSLGTAQRDRDE